MTLMGDLRSMFGRIKRRPVSIDLAEPEAISSNPILMSDQRRNGHSIIEAQPLDPDTSSEFTENSPRDEVMSTIRGIAEHLSAQKDLSGRLLEIAERIPDSLDQIPQLNRQTVSLMETISEHLGQARRGQETLNAALGRVSEASAQQAQVLGLLQQQLDANNQLAAQISESVLTFQRALSDLAQSDNRTANILSDMARGAENREAKLAQALHRTHVWMIAALVFCGIACAGAVIAAFASAR